MKKGRRLGSASKQSIFCQAWTFYFLSYFVCLTTTLVSGDNCPHPAVPYAATYVNSSGGADQTQWKVKYICDSGYELFGDDVRECSDGKWKGDLPTCAVNVAMHKPASSSSTNGGGDANNAVDGKTTTVHEGTKCTETKSEKSPWWTVDLLEPHSVAYVKLTTRCCDAVPVKKAEIRVGNSTTHGNNPLCNWIPKALEEGATETLECVESLVGRYVSVAMTGVETVLSLCEVQVFTSGQLSLSSCSQDVPPDEVTLFQDNCYRLLPGETSGFDEANDKCKESGYHLLDELTEASTAYVTTRLKQERKDDTSQGLMAWVGAQRKRTSNFRGENWVWASGGEVDDIAWGRGQPNNYNQEQNCAVLDSELDWGWNDLSCRISAVAVCRGPPSRCPNPPVAQATTIESVDHNIGGLVTYSCPVGEMPIGEVNQTCLASGQWSGLPIGCKPVECGQVPGLANGEIHVLDGRTTWGARVRYKCKQDYSLMEGEQERTCLEGGWSGNQPKCVFTKCPTPSRVANADLTQVGDNPNHLGAQLVYKCHEGYKATGSLSRECLLGGKWSGSEPSCEFVDCKDPPKLVHATYQLLDGRTTFGASAEYACDQDYLPVGDTTKRCEASGQWTRTILTCDIIKCPQPRSPSGGRVSGYNREVHSTIEYSCLPGHILEGDETVTCTSTGLWSSRTPNCRYIDCGPVPSLDEGTAHYVNGSTHLGSVVRYACDRSHSIAGDDERHCLANGRWSGTVPSCSEIRCSLPPRPNNTVISVSSTERLHGTSVIRSKLSMQITYRVGSTLKYRCERGYILENEEDQRTDLRVMTRRCTSSGTWTGSTPKCTFVDCLTPEHVEYSDYTLKNNGTYYGSIVTYQCHDHFKLDGFERRRCDASGKWEPEAPLCKETLCKPLDPPANGSMVLTTLRIGGTATFSCDVGFGLKGDDDIECLSSGSWSSWPPSCIEVDCGQPFEVENGRVFLTNTTTNIGSSVEYHCFPGYERSGPFQRVCLNDGYWSGPEPTCNKPQPVTILSDNTVDGTRNVRAGSRNTGDEDEGSSSSVGLYIGIALGLIVVVGLTVLGIYFYRKQRALATKPPAPYRDRNANSTGGGVSLVGGLNGYASTGVYHTANGGGGGGVGPAQRTAGIMSSRAPPPIQMYSMEEHMTPVIPGEAPRAGELGGPGGATAAGAPIYDTINDDSSGTSGYARSSGNGSDRAGYTPSTFKNGVPAASAAGYGSAHANGGYANDYDIPEGSDPRLGAVGAVTINGIAV